jgi:hypothetical protein
MKAKIASTDAHKLPKAAPSRDIEECHVRFTPKSGHC